jgi:hypothetical protein
MADLNRLFPPSDPSEAPCDRDDIDVKDDFARSVGGVCDVQMRARTMLGSVIVQIDGTVTGGIETTEETAAVRFDVSASPLVLFSDQTLHREFGGRLSTLAMDEVTREITATVEKGGGGAEACVIVQF